MRLSPAAGPPLASAPLAASPLPEPFFELLVLDFLVELFFEVPLPASSLPLIDFLVEVCVLLPEVVVAVSVVFVQEATKATPTSATMHERRDFFIGIGSFSEAAGTLLFKLTSPVH